MKALLTAIKSQLQTDLTYIRNSDIYVTEDERLIPEAVKFPAVGLKDGRVDYEILGRAEDLEATLYVVIIAYVRLHKAESAIMGDTATGKKGVLDIISDIKTALRFNLFSGDVQEADPISEAESELLADETTAIQMKSLTMRYKRY